jgi:hypothetical protein
MLYGGGVLTAVNVHASSGFSSEDQQCRVKQIEQIFINLGDGLPGLCGELNLAMGDFNTDPGRLADADPSARRLNDFAGAALPFHFISPVGPEAPPSYAGLFNIDHAIADRFEGSCSIAGITPDYPEVTTIKYFDHHPLICRIKEIAP